jgi:hypothetical protein
MGPLNEIIVRAGKSLAVHLLMGAMFYGLALWLMGSYESANEALRTRAETEGWENPAASIEALLGTARNSMIGWFMISLIVSWLCSSLFLAFAQRRQPHTRNGREGGQALPVWILLFVLSIVACAVLWWRDGITNLAAMVVDMNYLLLVSAGYLGVVLAYWLGSGLAVTITLKPSVPLANSLLPRFWN